MGARLQRERPCVALSFVREGVVGPSVCGVSEPRRRGGGRPCVALELFFWGVLRRGPRSAELIASDRAVSEWRRRPSARPARAPRRTRWPSSRLSCAPAPPPRHRRARARSELRFRLFLDGFPITDVGLSLSLSLSLSLWTRVFRESARAWHSLCGERVSLVPQFAASLSHDVVVGGGPASLWSCSLGGFFVAVRGARN